jgi:hypothetical protein
MGGKRLAPLLSNFPDVADVIQAAAFQHRKVNLIQGIVEAIHCFLRLWLLAEIDQRLIKKEAISIGVGGRFESASFSSLGEPHFRHRWLALTAEKTDHRTQGK